MKKHLPFIGSLLLIALLVYVVSEYSQPNEPVSKQKNSSSISSEVTSSEQAKETSILLPNGDTVATRYQPPQGYTRIPLPQDSFGTFLRNQKLKPYGEKVLYYDGKTKPAANVYDSVFDVDIGTRDLHQCADAIMLLRAEYLYRQQRYDEIQFHFVSGFLADFNHWKDGYRIKVNGNQVTWVKSASPSTSYETFRAYMDVVFTYAGTASLEKELVSVPLMEMQVGDVFIKGGSPGHAVIVIDMAENAQGEKVYMLAQSYMPAQQTQILVNNKEKNLSPWYPLANIDYISTPEWGFEKTQLKRFP
jgi:hypothetical protein